MMAGVLVTSIVSGQMISHTGRYRPFPILGTAIMASGCFLLSTAWRVDTRDRRCGPYMLVLGSVSAW